MEHIIYILYILCGAHLLEAMHHISASECITTLRSEIDDDVILLRVIGDRLRHHIIMLYAVNKRREQEEHFMMKKILKWAA